MRLRTLILLHVVPTLAVVAFFAAVFAYWGFVDDDPPDDTDLRPVREPVDEAENGYALLVEATDALSLPVSGDGAYTSPDDLSQEEIDRHDRLLTERELYDRMLEGTAWDDAVAAKILRRNAEALRLWREGMARPGLRLPEVTSFDQDVGYLFDWMRVVDVAFIEAEARRRAGDAEGALATALDVLSFGRRLEDEANCLVAWCVGATLQGTGRRLLADGVRGTPLSAERLRALAAQMRPYGSSRAGQANALRGEYVVSANTVDGVARGSIPLNSLVAGGGMDPMVRHLWGGWHRVVLKPNRTKGLFAEWYRAVVADVDQPLARQTALREGALPDRIRGLNAVQGIASGNAAGLLCISILAPGLGQVAVRRCSNDLEHSVLRLRLAARAYELEKGGPPTSLEALVPDYIEAVPADPFDGKPLRYDPKRRLVWSVGEDLVDDGAAVTFEDVVADRRKNEYGLDSREDAPEDWDSAAQESSRSDLPDPAWSLDIAEPFP